MLPSDISYSKKYSPENLLEQVLVLQQENLKLKLELKATESLLALEKRLSEIDRKSIFRVNKYFKRFT